MGTSKEETHISSAFVSRPWARVSRHDTSLIVQIWVQGRAETINPCVVRTPGNLRISSSVYDRHSLRPRPPGDIHPQCEDSHLRPCPHRPGRDHRWRQRIRTKGLGVNIPGAQKEGKNRVAATAVNGCGPKTTSKRFRRFK